MKPKLGILGESVRQNQLRSSRNTKKVHDAHCNVKTPNFAVGNRVWLSEQLPSKVKLGHKTSQKFKGPYLIVKANPEFFTYKLQNCKNNKIYPSLIHANRLRLCDTKRDKFYSKNAVESDGKTTSKTATDNVVEAGHKLVDETEPLALPLQTAAAATEFAANSEQAQRESKTSREYFIAAKL